MSARSRTFALRGAAAVAVGALALTVFAVPASAEPTWLPGKTLSPNDTNQHDGASVAVGGKGTAYAVWIRAAGATSTVYAARKSPTGAWGTPVAVSAGSSAPLRAHVVVDSAGNATVLWSPVESPGAVRAVTRSATAGSWSSVKTLATSGVDADLAVDEQGLVLAAWAGSTASGSRITVVRKSAAGSWGTAVAVSETGATGPQVGFDGVGNATAVWESGDNIRSARRPAGAPWTTAVTVAGSADEESSPVLTVDHSGNAVAAWNRGDRVEGAFRLGTGAWSTPAYVSAEGSTATVAAIVIDQQGNVVVGFNSATAALASTLTVEGAWSTPETLSEGGAVTAVSMDKTGNAVATLDNVDGVAQAVQRPQGGAWSSPVDLSADGENAAGSSVTHDAQGNAVTTWSADGDVKARVLDVAGPSTSMTQPAVTRQTSTSFTAAWSAADRWGAVGTKDVRFRMAPWNATYGEYTDWKTATTDDSGTVAGAPGNTYCFSARSRDTSGNEGAWSSHKCTATPLDDVRLSRSGTWTRGTNSAYYLGTYTSTKTNGAALIRTGVQARHISLLTTTCQTCGSVKVTFGGTSLGTFDLRSSTTARKKLISVKTFSTVRTGTLKIQVTSTTGRAVYLDGVVARRS